MWMVAVDDLTAADGVLQDIRGSAAYCTRPNNGLMVATAATAMGMASSMMMVVMVVLMMMLELATGITVGSIGAPLGASAAVGVVEQRVLVGLCIGMMQIVVDLGLQLGNGRRSG